MSIKMTSGPHFSGSAPLEYMQENRGSATIQTRRAGRVAIGDPLMWNLAWVPDIPGHAGVGDASSL